MPLTILPGERVQTDGPAEAPPAHRGTKRGPSVSRRTVALGVAAVVALGGGGAYLVTHKSASSTQTVTPPAPAAAAPAANHSVAHVKAKPAGVRTRAQAMQAALQIFPVLSTQLPGWQVSGKTAFDSGSSADPVSRQIDRCFKGHGGGVSVDSPSASQVTTTPTEMNVQANLTFVRSAAVAAKDLAAIRRPSVQQCIGASVLGRSVSLGPGATMRLSVMKPLRTPRRMFGLQFDGRVESNVLGAQSVRVVMLGTVHRATEVMVTSAGFNVALPVSTDRRVLDALTARTVQVLH